MKIKELNDICDNAKISKAVISRYCGFNQAYISTQGEGDVPDDMRELFATAIEFEIRQKIARDNFMKEQMKRRNEILQKRAEIQPDWYYEKIMKDIEKYSVLNEYEYE